MNTPVLRQSARSDANFFALTAMLWLVFFVFIPNHGNASALELGLFAVGASLISYLALKLFGYFDTFRLLPRKSDPALVLVAVPLGGIVQHTISYYVLTHSCCELDVVITWTPILAMAIFGTHYLMSWLLLRIGVKRKVVLDLSPDERAEIVENFVLLGYGPHIDLLSRQHLKEYLLMGRGSDIDLVIISRGSTAQFDAEALLIRAHLAGIPIVDNRKIATHLTGRIRLSRTDLWSYLLEATPQTPMLRFYSRFKVVVEPIMALVLAVILSPLIAVVALGVKLSSPGPILYRQNRAGYLGKNFTLIKFRSMRVDAERNGPQWASSNDDRVTPFGKFMRKVRLDELPQLWNVIKGEMSFFGPRPERPEIYQRLKKEIPLFSMRTIVRPGITGWAQVCAGYAASVEESSIKLEFDLFYIAHMSPRLDLIVLVKTLQVALFGSRVEREKQPQLLGDSEGLRSTGQ